ncbi:MAG: ATP-binding protein [Candidatus Latescibacterota bacterium]
MVAEGGDARAGGPAVPGASTPAGWVCACIPVRDVRSAQPTRTVLAVLAASCPVAEKDQLLGRIPALGPLLEQVGMALRHARLYTAACREAAERRHAAEALRREQAVREAESAVRLRIATMERPEDVFVLLREISRQLRLLGVDHRDVGIQVANRDGTDFLSMSESGCSQWEKVLAGNWEPLGHAARYPWVLEVWRAGGALYQPCLGREFGTLAGRSLIDVAFSRGTLAVNHVRARAFVEAEALPVLQRLAQVLTEGFQRFDDLVLRRQTTQALAESQARYRELFQHMSSGVAAYEAVDGGSDFVLLDMNAAGARICQAAVEQIVGRRLTEVFPGVERMGVLEILRRVWATGTPEHQPPTRYVDDRLSLWVENDVYRLPSGQLVAVFDDVGDRMRMAEELVHTQRLRAVGELSVGISHNLNNILTAVLGPAQLLERRLTDPEQLREVREVITGARRAAELVRRLHHSVRGAEEQLQPVALNKVVREAMRAMQARWREDLEARGVEVHVVLDLRPVPPVRATTSGLHSILGNLGLNAVEAMPQGGTIRVRTSRAEGRVKLAFADTGVGMDEETRRRVFEPFFTTKATVGTGLGLSTVHGSVAAWGGEIRVDSTPEVGTVFTLLLPVWEETTP